MLSGDRFQVVGSLANELGINEFYAEVTPLQKAEIVKKIIESKENSPFESALNIQREGMGGTLDSRQIQRADFQNSKDSINSTESNGVAGGQTQDLNFSHSLVGGRGGTLDVKNANPAFAFDTKNIESNTQDSNKSQNLDSKNQTPHISNIESKNQSPIINKDSKKIKNNVVMIGDGLNDSLALKYAQVAIAMGSGSDISINQSDVIILDDKLDTLQKAFKISKLTFNRIKQNLVMSLAYNTLAIPFALSGQVIPLFAALFMSLSSLCVVLNSLRLYKDRI
ncbi:HAD-IC family P-type ATPase [Helicobacter saguini]|uniref:Copper-transporting ATPase n=2 Tax=Helicobacter saguini TaxID=1548018 RepID=A0A347VUC1_9HELI|nr:HAD-IC family P-type ATPase [Helicobacter saguini]MWV66982.1 HAD-IC family P-type ATPase [Helicobacter saguini]MWV69330.1 HAD-IC family P-type ATPase [Helicobacter saguini]MWV71115.1 HAD-IC family P-type ATPase [Helicobacter saguini]TLD95078.1 cation-translocating P-type ATPase [Helicobacter saguini]